MCDRRALRLAGLLCVLRMLGVPAGAPAEITRYPYLQPTTPSDTTIGIAWRTAGPSGSRVEYGIQSLSEHSVQDDSGGTRHYIVLEGLQPGQVYQYRVISDGTTTPVYRLRTSPPDGNFRALLLSDTHAQRPGDRRHAQWLERWTKYLRPHMAEYDPHLVLICGDITQTGHAEEYEELFRQTREVFASAIVLLIQGNHDSNDEVFREQFYLPQNGRQEPDGPCYSFDYGGCHFLMMWRPNEAAATWAQKDLMQARGARFHFGMWHYPVYVDTWRELENELIPQKRQLIDLFDRHGMDIWLQGHRHTIQRTLPIVKNPNDPTSWGLIYSPRRSRYTAATRGTIYMQIRSSWYGPEAGHGRNPYMAYDDAGQPESIGYSTLDVSGAKCRIRSFSCTIAGQGWGMEDEFHIDETDRQDPAAPRFVQAAWAANVTAYRAEIRARTDVAARVVVDYGTEAGRYVFSTPPQDVAQSFGKEHSIWLQALEPQTRYFYRARASVEGKVTEGAEGSFVTGALGAGQVVAKFDFQPKIYVPPGDFGPAADEVYTSRARCGWVGARPLANRQFRPDYGEETATFCAVENDKPAARWQADIPNGTYDVQVGCVNAEEEAVTTGDTRVVLEAGQATMQAPAEPAHQILRTWSRRVTVRDGRLDLALGCEHADAQDASVISWLVIREAQGAEPMSQEPPEGIGKAASQPVESRRRAWSGPGQ